MYAKYSHTKKKKLAEKLEKLTNKKDLKIVKEIINTNNPDMDVVKKSSCVLMYFHNMTDKTYSELDDYITKKILKECAKKVQHMNELESAMSENPRSEDLNDASSINSSNKHEKKNKYKYSNKEKNLMRRKKYEKALNELNGTETLTVDFEQYKATVESLDHPEHSEHSEQSKSVFIKKN
jgi:hypothetical protein